MDHPDAVAAVYEQVADEIQRGKFDVSLMTRAVAESFGDALAARSLYTRLRVSQLHLSIEESLLGSSVKRITSKVTNSPPDPPLATFLIKEKGCFRPNFQFTIRERSLHFKSLRSGSDIEINPETGEFGVSLVAAPFFAVFEAIPKLIILKRNGTTFTFYITKEIYKLLKKWKLSNRM